MNTALSRADGPRFVRYCVVVRDAGLAAPFLLSALGLVLTACALRWLLVSAPVGAPLCGAKP